MRNRLVVIAGGRGRKTSAQAEVEDRAMYLGLIRLYVLCRADDGPISTRAISEELLDRGWMVSASSLAQFPRGLESDGYLKSEEAGHGRERRAVYRATRRGGLMIGELQRKLQDLFLRLDAKDAKDVDKMAISR